MPKAAAAAEQPEPETTGTTTVKVSSGVRSGELLALYNAALERGTLYNEFVEELQRIGGYSTELAARQRLTRFRGMLRGRGLQLRPLRGSPISQRDNTVLKSQFACLVDASSSTVRDASRELGLKRGNSREVKRSK
jgi:hypothetical protein